MKFSTQEKTCFDYREPLFSLQGTLFSLQGMGLQCCQNFSFVKEIYVDGEKLARNGQKTAIYIAASFFFSSWKGSTFGSV